MLYTGQIRNLSQDSRIKLRRAFGRTIEETGMEAVVAFYSVIPENLTSRDEHNLFFAVTLYCYYRDNADQGKRLVEAISTYYHLCTDSGKKDVLALMDAPYDMNGTFLRRLYSLVKKMESKEIYIDADDLYHELKYWDSRSKQRKIMIAKSIAGFKEDEGL